MFNLTLHFIRNTVPLVPAIIVFLTIISSAAAQSVPESARLGGSNTVFDTSEDAFTNPLPGLTANQLEAFEEGDELFEEDFALEDGLGPIMNATSCESCHVGDGRGRPPAFTGDTGGGLLIRLALPERDPDGSTQPDPIYGGQFQDMGAGNTPPEGTLVIHYQELQGTYADGTPYTLRAPQYELTNLNYGALNTRTTLSPRLAQQIIGLGLLEAVPEATLVAMADPADANGDGISGRPNYVRDALNGRTVIGRFGWKANQPNLLQQTLGAFSGDIGITSHLFPDQPCTDQQSACTVIERDEARPRPPRRECPRNRRECAGRDGDRNRPACPERQRHCRPNPDTRSSDDVEVSNEEAVLVTFYASTLVVPAQRDATSPQVMQGQVLFEAANCSGCHVTELQTGIHVTIPQLTNQTIHPYTDMLLHDMGEGLADNQADFLATGSEWRTPPLWGIGLLETVNGEAFYLHDGRARTIEEAILWHAGEAQSSRNAFVNMSAGERDALVSFVRSL